MTIVDITSRRIVSRDFISGSNDGIPPETPTRAVAHDYAGHQTSQTLRDRKRLGLAQRRKPSYPLDQNAHMRRVLKTEYYGGVVLGLIFGVFFTTVFLALSFPWWAPVMYWMARS